MGRGGREELSAEASIWHIKGIAEFGSDDSVCGFSASVLLCRLGELWQ